MFDHICNIGAEVSVNVFVKDSVDVSKFPVAVGVCEMFQRLIKGAIMPLVGWTYSWSLGNTGEHGWGYPFDQNFVFLILSFNHLLCVVIVSLMYFI